MEEKNRTMRRITVPVRETASAEETRDITEDIIEIDMAAVIETTYLYPNTAINHSCME